MTGFLGNCLMEKGVRCLWELVPVVLTVGGTVLMAISESFGPYKFLVYTVFCGEIGLLACDLLMSSASKMEFNVVRVDLFLYLGFSIAVYSVKPIFVIMVIGAFVSVFYLMAFLIMVSLEISEYLDIPILRVPTNKED